MCSALCAPWSCTGFSSGTHGPPKGVVCGPDWRVSWMRQSFSWFAPSFCTKNWLHRSTSKHKIKRFQRIYFYSAAKHSPGVFFSPNQRLAKASAMSALMLMKDLSSFTSGQDFSLPGSFLLSKLHLFWLSRTLPVKTVDLNWVVWKFNLSIQTL